MTVARAQCRSLGINKVAIGNFENKYKNVNAGGKLVEVVFTNAGVEFEVSKPPHVEVIELLVVGGGGGGGASTTSQAGAGGGAGAVVYTKLYVGGIPSWYGLVGKGGAGALGAATNKYGRQGEPSYFGPSSLRWRHTRFQANNTLPFGGGGSEMIGSGEDVYTGLTESGTPNIFAPAGSGGGGGGTFSNSMPAGGSHGGVGVGSNRQRHFLDFGGIQGWPTFPGGGQIGGYSGGTSGATSGAGGGGGCEAPGQIGTTSVGGNGGAGIALMGRQVGGGGGGGRGSGSPGTGVFGGGNGSTTTNASDAVDGSGSGGGGAGGNGTARNGGKGGNGIIVLRYYV